MVQVSGIEVRFTGDTSGLEKSVSRADAVINNFAKNALKGLAGALTAGALVKAGQAALDFADNIGKTAQKIGMTTEELSKLSYAAKLSDISMQELQAGLGQLSKNMEAGSEGLLALGVSATDSAGNLRSTAEVMTDVAEAFAGIEDGAGKTAIAMNIFGRSGANLIPLLNSGRAGLRQMGDEAKRLGVVISNDAAKAAETFNDNVTRLQAAVDGLTQQALAPLLPSLIKTTEALLSMADAGQSASDSIQRLSNWFETLHPSFARFGKEGQMVLDVLEKIGAIQGSVSPKSDLGGTLVGGNGPLSVNPGDGSALAGSVDSFGKSKAPALSTGDKKDKSTDSRVPGIAGVDAIDSFFIERLKAIQEGFMSEREMLAAEYAANQDVLQGALNNQLLSEQEYYDLSRKLAEDHQKELAGLQAERLNTDLAAAGQFFASMQNVAQDGGKRMLKVAKAFGAAQALVATFQAAAQAMTDWSSFTPMQKLAAYATILAQGMSAVRAIKGVSESGGGGGGSSSGGGRSAAMAAAGSGGGGGSGPTTTFQFTLTNDPMGFGEKFARQFIDQLNSTQRNGGQIRGVIA